MNDWLVVMRGFHFAACMLFVAILAFDRLIAGRSLPVPLRSPLRGLLPLLAAAAFVSGAGWFICVSMDMASVGLREAIDSSVLGVVWHQTRFGGVWQIRTLCWAVAAGAILGSWLVGLIARRRSIFKALFDWSALLAGAVLLGSLAWAGHGRSEPHTDLHLTADVVHLLAGAFWPAGLLPFGWVIWRMQRRAVPDTWIVIDRLTRRFSAFSLGAVAALAISGMANSYFLLASFSDLWRSRYGQVLSAKIIVFLVMICLGAVNLLWLKPRVATDPLAVSRLRRNVCIEFAAGMAVVVLVAFLGLLPPTTMGDMVM